MKYKLKRSPTSLIIASVALILMLAICIFSEASLEDSFVPGIIFILVFVGIIIYEAGRIRGDKFFFDENSFSIDGEKYTYSQIDYLQVYAVRSRYRRTENIDIFINDEYVFGFNKNYENSSKFIDFAQNHNVKVKVGLSDE